VSDYCLLLGLNNGSRISGAAQSSAVNSGVVVSRNPLGDIQKLRNFIAHKNRETHRDILPVIQGSTSHRIFLAQTTPGGITKFAEWIDSVDAIADAACY
jgi:hypothetical protein